MSEKRSRLSRRQLITTGLAAGGSLLVPAFSSLSLAGNKPVAATESATDLLIIGAGPFGLALSAFAREHGISHRMLGVPMGFWHDNMPDGMLLRSTCDWSLDPLGIHSIDAFLETRGQRCSDVEPLSRKFYLDYTRWFQEKKELTSENRVVERLVTDGADFVAVTSQGERIRSSNVVVAIGFKDFAHTPANLAAMFPRDRQDHTCFLVDFEKLKDRRVLIIGGRQSAFEWTALIREAGADAIHVSHRHDTPLFTTSEWSWVNAIVDNMSNDPGWFRRLNAEEKQQLNRRFWEEGRMKLEPWLAPRIDHPNVHLHPNTNVVGASMGDAGIETTLDNGKVITVDEVIFATGYRVDMQRVPFLANGLLPQVNIEDGYPTLDLGFQTSVPGLYVTSLAATRDFGSFLAFTVSVRAQAQVIGQAVLQRLATARAA